MASGGVRLLPGIRAALLLYLVGLGGPRATGQSRQQQSATAASASNSAGTPTTSPPPGYRSGGCPKPGVADLDRRPPGQQETPPESPAQCWCAVREAPAPEVANREVSPRERLLPRQQHHGLRSGWVRPSIPVMASDASERRVSLPPPQRHAPRSATRTQRRRACGPDQIG